MLNLLTKLSETLSRMQELSVVHMGIQPNVIQCSDEDAFITDIEDCVHYSVLGKSHPFSVGYLAYMAPETKDCLSSEEFFNNQNLVKMSVYSLGKLTMQMIGLLDEEILSDQSLQRFIMEASWKKFRQHNDKGQMEKLELVLQAMLDEKYYERVDLVGLYKLLQASATATISDLMNIKANEKEASQSRHNLMVSKYK